MKRSRPTSGASSSSAKGAGAGSKFQKPQKNPRTAAPAQDDAAAAAAEDEVIGEDADFDDVEEDETGGGAEAQGDDDADEEQQAGGTDADGDTIMEEGAEAAPAFLLSNEILKSTWQRQPVNYEEFDPKRKALVFQQMDADYYIAAQKNSPITGKPYPGPVDGNKAPIVRLYGVTQEGHSVLCHVRGYIPYFYCNLPAANFNTAPTFLAKFRDLLNNHLKNVIRRSPADAHSDVVIDVELVEKENLMYYSFGRKQRYLKISTALPIYVKQTRSTLEQGIEIPGLGVRAMQTYESNILFVLRCMIDSDIKGANWVELPASKWHMIPKEKKITHCCIEAEVCCEDLVSHEPVGDWGKIAPLRILSVDIECAGKDAHFPTPEQDPVIMIANYMTVQGNEGATIKNVFVLRGCENIVGADVHTFDKEEDMLQAWRNFIVAADPDILTGYNIVNFDFPYLLNRARKLKLSKFAQLGRIANIKSKMKNSTFSSKAYGTRESKDISIEGRVQLDVLQAVQRDYKLSSYSLNSVSAHFLGEQKDEVHHSDISKLHNGDDGDRRRLAAYCLKDAYLPQRLLENQMIVINYIEMARVTGIPLSFLLRRGQQIKVLSQLLRKARKEDKIMPTVSRANTGEETYAGATVIDPLTGFYDTPITTLDFASLYPSIMIAHNLCYTTLVKNKSDLAGLKEKEDYWVSPTGDIFMSESKCKGLLPRILLDLLEARKAAKNDLKKETDPVKQAVLNGRQLALKISANSVYGFTGAVVGHLPCLEISSTVTAVGRNMIMTTKKTVEEHYTIQNGYEHNAQVIYGDTDSVMIKFGYDLETSFRIGKEAAEFVSKNFTKPIKLEFEKVYFPYLLIAKKRYAGLYYTNPKKWDKLDAKGIETVRRDNCALVRNLINTCLHKLLIKRSKEDAIEYAKSVIEDLLMNRLDISMLVITKSISKKSEAYSAKQAHVELAKRMQERDPSTAPHTGDRVPYVIVKKEKGAKAYEKSEDPIYVLKNNIAIDTKYYLEHQVSKPLLNIFRAFMKNPQSLLTGDHTRSISILTPSSGGIAKFAKKRKQCLGCKASIEESTPGCLCDHCKEHESKYLEGALNKRNYFENVYSRVWTYCQRCQGSLHQEVICANRDCNLFYMREKVKKDLSDAQEVVDRFESVDW